MPEINPQDPEFIANPYPVYDRLRRTNPIFYDDHWKLWMLTTFEDISNLLKDKRLGRDIPVATTPEYSSWKERIGKYPAFANYVDSSFLEKEGPDHTRLRKLVHKVFTPRRVKDLRAKVQQLTDGLLDRVESRGHMDLLEDFATILPVSVIAELLGIPEKDRMHLRPWSRDIVRMYEFGHSKSDEEHAEEATIAFPIT